MGAEGRMAERENRKVQLVCLDYDGVLVDSLSRMVCLLARAQASLGIGRPPTDKDLRSIVNLSLKDLALNLGIPPEKIPELAAKASQIQREDRSRPAMFPGIPEVLRQIAEGSVIVIVSFNLRDEILDVLSTYSLKDCVSLILDGGDSRPKSERIRWALEHLDTDPQNAFMVGDARSDIREGRAAGVWTVAVTWGYQPREVLAVEDPDFVATHPQDLLAIVKGRG
jgi:phosphoglycolate phosphatase